MFAVACACTEIAVVILTELNFDFDSNSVSVENVDVTGRTQISGGDGNLSNNYNIDFDGCRGD
jgi:hypothetical protein